ncbi:MAG: hypothetical protein PUH21_07725 [Prevotellaceae bacterium]|jgi:hypothetical protein|nr:hypothetical protein [Prevotellaceae bacterium]MDY3855982.1 hypothetical protein [Bacteroidaceae bacterium]
MLFKILIVSDEVDDFQREITIDADATFLDLNQALLKACGYKDDQVTSFYICDENWEQREQIMREDLTDAADQDVYLMSESHLRDFLNDVGDRLVFEFDPLGGRMLFIKVKDIITGKNLKTPKVTLSHGKAPAQTKDNGLSLNSIKSDEDLLDSDDSFYGSEGFNDDEFDPDSFEISDQ